MWEIVKTDATTKSTLYLIDAEDQLTTMRVSDSDDPCTHLTELKQHFETMVKRRDNLIQMGSTLLDTRFSTIIMSSLPSSYRPAIQTITAAEKIGATQGTATKLKMLPTDLINFFTEEVHHHVIEHE